MKDISIFLLKQLVLFYLMHDSLSSAVKVVELGSKLPQLVKIHPDKSWLIKFYAPWCHYCKQLEPTFNVVAERLYQKYDNLIVGKVDCTSGRGVCSDYGVESFPTIIFINQDTKLKFNHEREANAIVSFADRLMAPDVSYLKECRDLDYLRDKHGIIIVASELNQSDDLYKHLRSLIPLYKSTWWFYFLRKRCKSLVQERGLFILKANSKRASKFDEKNELSETALVNWIESQSFPIYSKLGWMNYEKFFMTGKLIVLAFLDEYKPTRKLSPVSKKYSQLFHDFAISYSNENDDELMFAWSSDFELVSMLTLSSLNAPNVVFLKPDYSYYIVQRETPDLSDSDLLPANLTVDNIEKLINDARLNILQFSGGNSVLHEIYRSVYRNAMRVRLMYESQPLLFLVLVVPPILIVMFVLYSTCYDEKEETGKEALELSSDEDDGDEELSLLNQAIKSGKKVKLS